MRHRSCNRQTSPLEFCLYNVHRVLTVTGAIMSNLKKNQSSDDHDDKDDTVKRMPIKSTDEEDSDRVQ